MIHQEALPLNKVSCTEANTRHLQILQSNEIQRMRIVI